ncbi:MAG: DCL family protein [Bdellovibrionales bacterium]|nr:DCL family protein [Bdellovibrionales bacterium]
MIKLNNGKKWEKAGDAVDYFREMLARYSVGEKILAPQDHGDLASLLERYDSMLAPGEETKIGCGIKFFTKENNAGENWSTDGFWVTRLDGTSCDFSFRKALAPLKNKNHDQDKK